ncbi:MAG TPA: methyltransferase domain-containing protein [Patescibacteria group bacterium]|nr:methyltransferase domain-containing protein [Patescibacteria group bacterium]
MTIINPKWSQNTNPVLINNLNILKPGTVLDIGGSDGVNDLFLAKNKFKVTNIDVDKEALEILSKESKLQNLKIETINADLNNFQINNNYDNIICFYVLHFLEKEIAINLIKDIKNHTNKNGINIIITFTNKGEFEINKKRFYPTSEEFIEFYKDWEILYKNNFIGQTKSGKNQQRIILVAKKN